MVPLFRGRPSFARKITNGPFGWGGEDDRTSRRLSRVERPPATDWCGGKTPESSFTTTINVLSEVDVTDLQLGLCLFSFARDRPRIRNSKRVDELRSGVIRDDRVACELRGKIVRGIG